MILFRFIYTPSSHSSGRLWHYFGFLFRLLSFYLLAGELDGFSRSFWWKFAVTRDSRLDFGVASRLGDFAPLAFYVSETTAAIAPYGLWGSNAPWSMCWFRRCINCFFCEVYLTSFLPFPSLLFFFPYTFFLTYLIPYLFTSWLVYFFQNRPVPFPGWRS